MLIVYKNIHWFCILQSFKIHLLVLIDFFVCKYSLGEEKKRGEERTHVKNEWGTITRMTTLKREYYEWIYAKKFCDLEEMGLFFIFTFMLSVKIPSFLFLSIWLFLFSFPALWCWVKLPRLCWIEIVRADIISFFLISVPH